MTVRSPRWDSTERHGETREVRDRQPKAHCRNAYVSVNHDRTTIVPPTTILPSRRQGPPPPRYKPTTRRPEGGWGGSDNDEPLMTTTVQPVWSIVVTSPCGLRLLFCSGTCSRLSSHGSGSEREREKKKKSQRFSCLSEFRLDYR